jgi:hypothetical protein
MKVWLGQLLPLRGCRSAGSFTVIIGILESQHSGMTGCGQVNVVQRWFHPAIVMLRVLGIALHLLLKASGPVELDSNDRAIQGSSGKARSAE